MTVAKATRTTALGAGLLACALALAACGAGEKADGTSSTEGLEVTTSQTPTFVPEDNPQHKNVGATEDAVEDPGLHLEYTLQGTVSGLSGGSIITVMATNLNDVPVPPEALDKPKLKLSDGTEVDSLDAEASGVAGMDGLDRPLGAGATTNLRYPFDVAPGNLSNAEFTIGNVTFTGQL